MSADAADDYGRCEECGLPLVEAEEVYDALLNYFITKGDPRGVAEIRIEYLFRGAGKLAKNPDLPITIETLEEFARHTQHARFVDEMNFDDNEEDFDWDGDELGDGDYGEEEHEVVDDVPDVMPPDEEIVSHSAKRHPREMLIVALTLVMVAFIVLNLITSCVSDSW